MTRTTIEQSDTGIAREARTRVRLPERPVVARIFQGWGPTV